MDAPDINQQDPNPANAYVQAIQSGNAPQVTPQPSQQPADDSGNAAPSPALASPQTGQPNAPASPAAPAPAPHENFAHKFIGFVNRDWPTFDHPIWSTPLVNQLHAPGRSVVLRRP
jgi:hypothetical protein